jgi:hypothetical protein
MQLVVHTLTLDTSEVLFLSQSQGDIMPVKFGGGELERAFGGGEVEIGAS